jgi:predicted GNAT family acetyltransferase
VLVDIEVRKAGGVYYIKFEDGSKAYLAIEVEGGVMKLVETYVPESKRGHGYARVLVERAIEDAVRSGLKVLPICSYAVWYFMKNRDRRDVLVDELRNLSDDGWTQLYEARRAAEAAKRSGKA